MQDVGNPSYWDALLPVFVEVMADRVACVAFPAEAAAEMCDERGSTLDDPGDDTAPVPLDEDLNNAVDREKDLLDAMPLPGTPVDEAERRRSWIALPLRVRTAIRRMHRQFGHPSPTVLVQILRAARAPSEYVQACRHFRCDACEENKPKHQSTKVALPKDYVFGRNLGIDVLEVKDVADEPYLCLNILDLGTTFQQVVLLRQGHGSPSSRECLDSFVSLWVGWAGWPQTLSCDRGVHNRGVFARTLAQHGVLIRQAGVESPEQIGRVERHGGLFKAMLKRMITEHAVQGFDDMKVAVAEAVSTKNNLSRNGGFSPSQWVFGTLPRGPGDQFDEQEFADLGPLQGQLEPGTAFVRRAELRASARRAFIREDCGRRVARAVLRKAAPLVGEYATGDIVCYRKEDQGWSPACRLIGFDGNKTAWLICAGTPVCAAVDRLRPATSAEALAMQFAQNAKYEPGHPEDQQAFVDARASLNRDEDELVDDSLESRPVPDTNDPETPHSLMEPEFERGNTPPKTRPRSSEESLNDGPITLRRRVEAFPQQMNSTPGELRADQGASITDHWNHSGAVEPSFELVERQQDRERDETNALIAFYNDRGVGCNYRTVKKGKKSRNINFETSDQFTQSGLTESRKVEWNKWKHFNAVYPVSGPELEQLLDQGHKPIPLQWVDTDKNEHKRREGGPYVAPLFKSRLVSRGDLEETTGVRTDSPTCDIESLNILLSWASCERLAIKSGDITNAYFQGCPLERLILMRQPSGGVPDVDVSADTMFVARVPIYGTCDAGRGFWKKLRHDIVSTGLKENAVIRALYIYQEDGEPKSMLATHVDDMLWATKPGYEDRVLQLLDRYTIKTVESGTFRFCGRDVILHPDFSISVKCKDTTEKIEPVRYDPKGRKQTDLARDHEINQLRSVVGSLAWVARQCRPQLSYGVNKLQSVCGTATLEDLKFANKLLQEAKESSDDGLFFKSGLFTWNKMEMLTITDSSFGNESNFRSQKGRMTFLSGPDSFSKDGMGVQLFGYSSTIIGRVCRSTLQAETYALTDGVEESMRLRAALADAHGVFLRTDWEYHTARFMRNVWLVDCNSLNDHLRNPTFTKCSDKRLSIDLAALRQMIWLTPDGELREEIGSDQPDMVRWIDTSCMVADCLTKRMRSGRLNECFRTCWLDLIPTDESVLCKMKKQKGRANPGDYAGDTDANNHSGL